MNRCYSRKRRSARDAFEEREALLAKAHRKAAREDYNNPGPSLGSYFKSRFQFNPDPYFEKAAYGRQPDGWSGLYDRLQDLPLSAWGGYYKDVMDVTAKYLRNLNTVFNQLGFALDERDVAPVLQNIVDMMAVSEWG